MNWIGFDFETSGELPEYALQPWRVAQGKAWVTSFVWIHGKTVNGGLDPKISDMRRMLEYAIQHDIPIVGWNVVFDISWLLAYGLEDLVFKVKWLDGMLLWRHADIEPEYETDRPNKRSYGLKPCVKLLLPQYGDYAEDVDFHDPSPAARAKLHKYNVRDVLFTLRCAMHWWGQLSQPQQQCASIEAECLPLVAQANLNGMVVDTLAAKELEQSLADRADDLFAKLAIFGVNEAVVRSPTKLAKLLYDDWGLPVLKENRGAKTGKISRATDKEVLHELAFIDDRAADLRTYRECLNNSVKFAKTPLAAAEYNGDDRAHPSAIVFGTYSGRLTYASKQGKGKDERQTGFALHQEKRDKEYRAIILAPPGYCLMEFDASGQEFRWMAIASGDPTMLSLCAPGEDPHAYMGARIDGMEYSQLLAELAAKSEAAKNKRQLGKIGNLSLQYRTSAKKLRTVARVQYKLPMELPEAQRIHRTYQLSYPQVPRYWNRQIELTRRRGYVETYAGRRVKVVGNWEGKNGWSMGSTSINYRIQGTGADQKYLALMVLKDYLQDIGGLFAWDLHDGIYLYIPEDMKDRAAVEIKALLDNLPYQKAWGFTPPITLPWDCKVGYSWGTLEEYKFK